MPGMTCGSFVHPLFESCEQSLTSFTFKGNLGRDCARSILSVLPSGISTLHLQQWPYSTRFVNTPPLFHPFSPPPQSAVWLPKLEAMRIFEVPSPHVSRAAGQQSIDSLLLFLQARAELSAMHSRLVSLGVTRSSMSFPEIDFQKLGEMGLNVIVWAKAH
ncbi:hypothetical protein BKA70DRAFT_1435347 [Coprinopsis sp. MPI-PUGE-AT-0042]|nr:hypothetical protein BKA70DRAFT_1435347 [Coprinopsis sp. MPI-PUGE-AT-0042]